MRVRFVYVVVVFALAGVGPCMAAYLMRFCWVLSSGCIHAVNVDVWILNNANVAVKIINSMYLVSENQNWHIGHTTNHARSFVSLSENRPDIEDRTYAFHTHVDYLINMSTVWRWINCGPAPKRHSN